MMSVRTQCEGLQQMAAERPLDKVASDEACTKQRGIIEFLYAEKWHPLTFNECLLNASGDQPVDVSTVRW